MAERRLSYSSTTDKIKTIETNIYDIKENKIFGLFVSKEAITAILPKIYVDQDHYMNYDLTVDWYLGEERLKTDTFEENIPLVFKKLNDNYAQELLSKEVFIIDNGNYFSDWLNEAKTYTPVVEKYNEYRNNNVLLDCVNYDPDNKEEIDYCFCSVDSNFRKLYEEKTLPKKEEIISNLKEIKKEATEEFDKVYEVKTKEIYMQAKNNIKRLIKQKKAHR